MAKPLPLAKMTVPVLDVYHSKDYPVVLCMAAERKTMMDKAGNPPSAQQMINGAEHYFNGHNDALIKVLSDWLCGLRF